MTLKHVPEPEKQIPARVLLAVEAIHKYGPSTFVRVMAKDSSSWVERSAARVLAEWITENQANIRVVDEQILRTARRVHDAGPRPWAGRRQETGVNHIDVGFLAAFVAGRE